MQRIIKKAVVKRGDFTTVFDILLHLQHYCLSL